MSGDEIKPPEAQAEEALREAYRQLAAETQEQVNDQILRHHGIPPPDVIYPQCSNGPDCQCPFHFGLERVRVCCAVCGLAGSHGDRMHIYTVFPDHTELRPGPDATGLESYWPGYDDWRRDAEREQRAMADAHEARLRRRRREIAEQPGRREAGWQPGTCTGCGMDDGKVKGPPGAELCRWCDELRIMAPAPAPPAEPPEPVPTFRQYLMAHVASRSFAISCALIMTGSVMMLTSNFTLGAALWLAGMLWPTQRR